MLSAPQEELEGVKAQLLDVEAQAQVRQHNACLFANARNVAASAHALHTTRRFLPQMCVLLHTNMMPLFSLPQALSSELTENLHEQRRDLQARAGSEHEC